MVIDPQIVLPTVVMSKKESTFVMILGDVLIEQVVEDLVHLLRHTFEEHADSSFEQAVTCKDHLVYLLISI